MKNVKDQVYAALAAVFDNVTDQYPSHWASLPAVQYTEEDNKVAEKTSTNKEEKAYVRYRIDIFDSRSTSQAALLVDEAISALGLVRTACMDAPDPSGLKHKVMRYEGFIDMWSDAVYWPD